MKKQYEAPKAEKVEFDYKEMVTASGPKKEHWNCKCKEIHIPTRYSFGCNPCK